MSKIPIIQRDLISHKSDNNKRTSANDNEELNFADQYIEILDAFCNQDLIIEKQQVNSILDNLKDIKLSIREYQNDKIQINNDLKSIKISIKNLKYKLIKNDKDKLIINNKNLNIINNHLNLINIQKKNLINNYNNNLSNLKIQLNKILTSEEEDGDGDGDGDGDNNKENKSELKFLNDELNKVNQLNNKLKSNNSIKLKEIEIELKQEYDKFNKDNRNLNKDNIEEINQMNKNFKKIEIKKIEINNDLIKINNKIKIINERIKLINSNQIFKMSLNELKNLINNYEFKNKEILFKLNELNLKNLKFNNNKSYINLFNEFKFENYQNNKLKYKILKYKKNYGSNEKKIIYFNSCKISDIKYINLFEELINDNNFKNELKLKLNILNIYCLNQSIENNIDKDINNFKLIINKQFKKYENFEFKFNINNNTINIIKKNFNTNEDINNLKINYLNLNDLKSLNDLNQDNRKGFNIVINGNNDLNIDENKYILFN
ncbi:unnamed protein product [[Candida] boidinii]|uniref:Unnamed protein product n=1 Tax=Candida boidinii TaxID=5477 RepID=A0ACB5TGL2_CANBO|nr:unnamed protein product [[Candida] boidinii]